MPEPPYPLHNWRILTPHRLAVLSSWVERSVHILEVVELVSVRMKCQHISCEAPAANSPLCLSPNAAFSDVTLACLITD